MLFEESTKRASWRADLRHDWRALLVGVFWTRESKQYGELLSVYLCVVPSFPLVVTRLAYRVTRDES